MSHLIETALLSIVLAWPLHGGGESAQDILEKMKKQYESISDAQIRFSQKTRFELSKVEQNVSGTLFLKKTNKYRLETDEQTLLTNGETVWAYSTARNQVLIDHFKIDENAVTPEKILAGTPTDYSLTLLGRDRIGKTEVVALKLIPKNDQSMVKTLKLWVDNATWFIKKAEITDVNGKQTEYLVIEMKTNIGLEDSRFIYKVPEGTEVVDLR
jgi:outer membrane lipoprotein carrier protein